MNKSDNDVDMKRDWEINSTEVVYDGYYNVEKLTFTHALFNGGSSGVIDREQFVRGNVVGVIAHDPKLDKIALVEQFRIGARNYDNHLWLMEVIAGMVDAGEQPEDVAVRESYEEAGIRLKNVKEVMRYLASPGCTTEEVFLYYGEADLSGEAGLFGLEEEGEDIKLHIVSAEDAIAMLDNGKVSNALSIIALQWFRHSRLGC